MNQSDDDEATAGTAVLPLTRQAEIEEAELARRAGAGEQQAFDLLYDRYFARTSWYFTIFGQRKAKLAVSEVLTELFGSLNEPSDLSLAERAYRLARVTELRHAAAPAKARATKSSEKAATAQHGTVTPRS